MLRVLLSIIFGGTLLFFTLPDSTRSRAIPVFFHIIVDESGAEPAPDESVLIQQLDSLNNSFSDSNLSFRLAGFDFYPNDTWYDSLTVNPVDHLREEMFFQLGIDPARLVNVYTARLPKDSFHGVSRFPGEGDEGSPLNGILLDYRVLPGMGGKPNQPTSDEGDWLVHEMGHYFGLFHTFEAGPWVCSEIEKGDEPNCSNSGDELCDTLPHLQPLPDERVSCSQAVCLNTNGREAAFDTLAHNSNFMNYTSDQCRNRFTPGQLARMNSTAEALRPTLVGTARFSIPERADLTLNIFPNPASNTVSLRYEVSKNSIVRVRIVDALGRNVINQNFGLTNPGTHIQSIGIDTLPSGTYIATIQSGPATIDGPFVVVR